MRGEAEVRDNGSGVETERSLTIDEDVTRDVSIRRH